MVFNVLEIILSEFDSNPNGYPKNSKTQKQKLHYDLNGQASEFKMIHVFSLYQSYLFTPKLHYDFETHLIGPYLVEAHKLKPLASVSVFFTDHHGGNSPIDQIPPAAYLTVTISVARRRSIKKQNDVAEAGGSSPILDIQPKTPKSSMDDIPCCLVLRFYREERQSHAFAGQFIIFSLPQQTKTLSFAFFY